MEPSSVHAVRLQGLFSAVDILFQRLRPFRRRYFPVDAVNPPNRIERLVFGIVPQK
jgi:hypothetical protein